MLTEQEFAARIRKALFKEVRGLIPDASIAWVMDDLKKNPGYGPDLLTKELAFSFAKMLSHAYYWADGRYGAEVVSELAGIVRDKNFNPRTMMRHVEEQCTHPAPQYQAKILHGIGMFLDSSGFGESWMSRENVYLISDITARIASNWSGDSKEEMFAEFHGLLAKERFSPPMLHDIYLICGNYRESGVGRVLSQYGRVIENEGFDVARMGERVRQILTGSNEDRALLLGVFERELDEVGAHAGASPRA
ncbi:MAG: hypothetical protein NT157_04050 [Candidatus Micrarchaeota archaeon]|nr:hypothetical protein [Candidatus Micrarchaeota archaeon]